MYASKCVLDGKYGVEELTRKQPYAIVANRTLYHRGQAHKFAVVNVERLQVETVYQSYDKARFALWSEEQRRETGAVKKPDTGRKLNGPSPKA